MAFRVCGLKGAKKDAWKMPVKVVLVKVLKQKKCFKLCTGIHSAVA